MTQIHHFMDDDPATAPIVSETVDMADEIDTPLDALRDIVSLPDTEAELALAVWLADRSPREDAVVLAAEMFRVCLIQIMESKAPKREAWIWAMVAGMECTMGVEMKAIARRFRLTKQAVSKAVNDRVDRFGLRRNANLRSDSLRLNCSKAHHKRNHSEPGEHTNSRQMSLQSIESVVARFRGWCNTNQVPDTLKVWTPDHLLHVRDALAPIAAVYVAAGRALERSL